MKRRFFLAGLAAAPVAIAAAPAIAKAVTGPLALDAETVQAQLGAERFEALCQLVKTGAVQIRPEYLAGRINAMAAEETI